MSLDTLERQRVTHTDSLRPSDSWRNQRLAWLVITLWGCSDGHLDAFTLEAASGGAMGGATSAHAGAGSGGTTNAGASSGGTAGNANGGVAGNASGGFASGGAASGGFASAGTASSPLLLDDFEDGDNQTLQSGGWWFPTSDGSSTLNLSYSVPSTRNGASTHALHAFGSGFKNWCFVGLDLPGQPNLDARAYTRFGFWARVEPGSVVHTLSVDVLDSTHVNVTDSTALHFRKDIEVTSDWTNYTLAFSEFMPTSGDDATLTLDRSDLGAVEFWVFSPESFDFMLDDVELLP